MLLLQIYIVGGGYGTLGGRRMLARRRRSLTIDATSHRNRSELTTSSCRFHSHTFLRALVNTSVFRPKEDVDSRTNKCKHSYDLLFFLMRISNSIFVGFDVFELLENVLMYHLQVLQTYPSPRCRFH